VTDVLAGRTAIVTGASKGIGLATVRALAAAGVRVALVARSVDVLREIAGELGDAALPLACDVADAAAVGRAVGEAIDRLGAAPDILVNSAGTFELARVDVASIEDVARTIDVNLIAPFAFIRTVLPGMRERGRGHIVNVGSIADRVAFPENGAYAASKFGLRGLHEVLRAECRGTGVRTTLVSPGPVNTGIWDAIDPDAREGFTPRDRMLTPEAIASAIVYALSQPVDVNVDELRLSRS
jgi:NADP-dependent 3-hydroxy acid dehydrogenase YdfG